LKKADKHIVGNVVEEGTYWSGKEGERNMGI